MTKKEFDKLVRRSKPNKKGETELLFGVIDKELRKHGLDPKKGVGFEFTDGTVTVWQLGKGGE